MQDSPHAAMELGDREFFRVYALIEYTSDEGFKVKLNQCIEYSPEGLAYSGGCPAGANYIDYSSWLMIPALCNAHIHLPDYFVAEHGEEMSLSELVEPPHGLKYKLLESVPEHKVEEAMGHAIKELWRLGVQCTAAYFELSGLGYRGAQRTANSLGLDLRPFIQPKAKNLEEYIQVVEKYKGLGMDTVFDLSPDELSTLSAKALKAKGHIQVHVSETIDEYEKRDYVIALERLAPDNTSLVHLTQLGFSELKTLAMNGFSMIFCPRSNNYHGLGLPPLVPSLKLWLAGDLTLLALGTDNAGWIPLDPLGEAQYAYIAMHSRISNPYRLAELLLYAITIGCQRVVKCNKSSYILLRLPEAKWSSNIIATIVKRGASSERMYVERAIYGGNS
ncbi:MAG: amidohydrolase family protein [Pyrodictiaceae archaeon]